MRAVKRVGKWIWKALVVLSVIVNIILIVVVAALAAVIFDIKREIAAPLITGLHSSFIGLDQATIDWTIPVRADVPVNLNIPLQQNTTVTLTDAVPLSVFANISAPGLTVTGATVNLSLPAGLQLPVSLDLNVPVTDSLPVALEVRAVIPLAETQLHDVADNLRLLFEPLAVGVENLPDDFGETFALVGDVISGRPVDLLADNAYTSRPWPGFSRTAGLNYPQSLLNAPWPPENRPVETGITMIGGIPMLDQTLRPEVYSAASAPASVNTQAFAALEAQGIPQQFYDGGFAAYRRLMRGEAALDQPAAPGGDSTVSAPTPVMLPTDPPERDLGIIPTPIPGQ